jgi:DNA segregation ATPase FtsK/SpoIIIE-like protein
VLVLATQHPKAEVLNTLIRENFSTRIAFRVTTLDHSKVILGEGGAQEIPRTVRGRLVVRLDGDLTTLQGYYLADETLQDVARQIGGDQLGVSTSPLSEDEAALVRYALDELGGNFCIDDLAAAFQGEISRARLLQLGQRWAAWGWLAPRTSVTTARRVTDQLAALVQDE